MSIDTSFRLVVEDVAVEPGGDTIVIGFIESGVLRVKDMVKVSKLQGATAIVTGIEIDRRPAVQARQFDDIRAVLHQPASGSIQRGDVLVAAKIPARRTGSLNRKSATAKAMIVDRRMEKELNASLLMDMLIPVAHTDYYVVFEFDAAQAVRARGIMRLEAQVGKDLYERLAPGTTVNVRYAVQDPRTVLLDGE